MKASIANQNLISTSPLFPSDKENFSQNSTETGELSLLNKNKDSSGIGESAESLPPDDTGTTGIPSSGMEKIDQNKSNDNLTPYEVNHVIVGELESEDDVWLKQKHRTDAFLNGLDSAKKWKPVLTGDTSRLPDTIRTRLYDPDIPDEDQEEDVMGDIMHEWFSEHFTANDNLPKKNEQEWGEIRESMAESLDVPPDNSFLYQSVSKKNREYNRTLEEVEKQFRRVEEETYRHFSGSEEEQNFTIPEDWLNNIPEEIRPQVELSLEEHHRIEAQRVKKLKPVYEEMRKAIRNMASFEEIKTVGLPMGNKAGGYEELQFPLMFDIPGLIEKYPALSLTGLRLRQLPPEDRLLLFSQIDKDIMEERKKNPPQEKGFLSDLGHAISRSHMKGIYGIANLSKTLDAFSKDITANILDLLPESEFGSSLSLGLKELAQRDRDTMANVQRMRDLAENRENPLYAPVEEQTAGKPKPHWLKQCFLGFGEEAVPIALAVSYKPALLGWGGAAIGNKYSRYEAEAGEKRDYEAVLSGKEKKASSLSNANRLLSAVAMGSLQTLLEAGAYGKTFSPIVKSMPKVSAAVGIGVRPYVEQKAIALTEPLGSVSAEYVTRGLEEGKWDTFDSERMAESFGTAEDNAREYLMNLPFMLLATGKVALHHFKSRKTILNDPALSTRYKIPQKTINRIKREKNHQAQSLLLQKALRESPLWETPGILYQTSEFLNKIDIPFDGNTMGKYTPGNLAQLLELPPEKIKNHIGDPLPEQSSQAKTKVPFSFEKLTPLEKKQRYWHFQAELPSLSPVIKNNQLLWELKYPQQKNKYNGEGTYKSPDMALERWQWNNRTSQFFDREQALFQPELRVDPVMLKVGKEGREFEAQVQKLISGIDSLSAERLLFRSNSSPFRQQGKRALNTLHKSERERAKAHVIEDTMQYAMEVPAEQIVANRLARMWSDELKQQRISPGDAADWVKQWENISQSKLPPLSIEGFSTKVPFSSLSKQLAQLSLNQELLDTAHILPPAFTEPARMTFKQLADAERLSELLPETLFYSSQRKRRKSVEEAFYATLKNYIPQLEKTTLRNTTHFKKSGQTSPLLTNKPPILDNEFKQDLMWLDEQGQSPLLSLSDKKTGKTQWLTVYPDGRFSRPHSTPHGALLEWQEYGQNTRKLKLYELGKKATDSLIDFYYGKNGEKRPEIKLKTSKNSLKKNNDEWSRERDSIYQLQNPHVDRKKLADSYDGGSNRSDFTELGEAQHHINLYEKNDPLSIIEEHAEISWENLFQKNSLSLKEAANILNNISKETHNTYLPQDLAKKSIHLQYFNICEGLSQLSREYMMTQHSNKNIPGPLREWISHMYASPWKDLHAIPLLRRSTALNKVIESGGIPQDTLNMIKESVGLNERFNNERKFPYSVNRQRLIPLLDNPRNLFDTLPEQARLDISKKILALKEESKTSPSGVYKKTKQELARLQKDISRYPELLDWDFDEATKTYRSLNDFENQMHKSPNISGLSKDQIEKNIHAISLLRRSLDNMPYSDASGIRLQNKTFSATSPDRPVGMDNTWQVHMDGDSEGLVYTREDRPGHIVRLSPGFLYDPHNKGQRPYIRHIVGGNYLDAQGNIKSPYSPDTFIPLEKFSYVSPHSLPQASHDSFIKLLTTLSDKKRLNGLLYTPNIAEMSTPTEIVFQLGELKKNIPLDKKEMEVFNSLYKSANRLRRYPSSPQTDLNSLSDAARKLEAMIATKRDINSPPSK